MLYEFPVAGGSQLRRWFVLPLRRLLRHRGSAAFLQGCVAGCLLPDDEIKHAVSCDRFAGHVK